MRPTHSMRSLISAATVTLMVLAVGASGAAQDVDLPHPTHIHDGTCEGLGDIVHPLSDVSSEMLVDGQPGAGEVVGVPSDDPADQVLVSVTTVDATLEDLTSAEFAINVHLSADAMDVFIACGDVAGTLVRVDADEAGDAHATDDPGEADIPDDSLAIRLRERSDSGFQGIAWLTPSDDPEQTSAYLFLVQDPLPEPLPIESPAAASPTATTEPAESPAPPSASPAPPSESPAPTVGGSMPPSESPAPTARGSMPPSESPAPTAGGSMPPAESPAPESPSA